MEEEKKQRKIKKILEVAVKGEEAILDSIFEIEDKLEELVLEKGEKGDTGEKGDCYELTEEDKKEIASLIEVPVVEKVVEKVIEKTEVIKEQPIVTEVTKITNEVKEVAKSDTAEQIVEKINSTEKSIDFKTLKNYPDYSEEIKRLKTIVNTTPAITTSFINGTRAKNINFSGATVSYKDDTATVTIPTTDLSGYVPYTGATANVNLGAFTLTTHSVLADATDGLLLESANGTDIGILGAANTANVTWYGSHNFSTATADTIAIFGASKTLSSASTATYPSLTELSYVKGVTSAIQTQINAKFTLPSLTSGSVLFSDGSTISQDNANFFWDNTNKQLKIGSTSSANATTTNPLTVTKTSTSYVAVHIQNLSSGTAASTDLIIANNNDDGTVSTGKYFDAGINGDGYTGSSILSGAGDAYIYNNLEDLIIATGTAGKNVIIATGGFGGTAASKTRATFTDTGLQMMNGSASAPSVSGTGATTTGFYWAATPSVLTAIAGVNRLTHSATTWSLNSSNGGTLDIGGTSQYMDFGGTIVAGAATFQGLRTTGLIWDMQVSRTNSFGLNNANTIGGSTGSLTLTTMTGARSGNVTTGTIGVAITTSNAFEAREFNNGSGGTVTVTNNFGFNASQNMTTGTAINAAFSGNNTANATRWNLYMSTTAQNWLAGNLGLGSGLSAPAAKLHIAAGSATAGTAQIKLDASTLLSTPENGAVEATSSHLYFTAGGVRYQLDQQAGGSGLSQAQVLTIASMRF